MVNVGVDEVHKVCTAILLSRGYHETEVSLIVEILLYAEKMQNSQGIAKLLVKGAGSFESIPPLPTREAKIVFDSAIACKLNGNGSPGMTVMNWAVDIALEKARQVGIGCVGTFNTNTGTGAIGYYAERIASQGFLAFIFSGSSPNVAPHGSREKLFGTNPLGYGIPVANMEAAATPSGDDVCDKRDKEQSKYAPPIVFDMTTSSIPFWGLKAAQLQNQPIPEDVAIDAHGNGTTNPHDVEALLPFASHKGSGLSLLVEYLTGPLVSGSFADRGDCHENFGNLVVAVDPNLFGNGETVLRETAELMERIRKAKPKEGADRVYLPGDRSREKRQLADQVQEIGLSDSLWSALLELKRGTCSSA
eukprot:CAMPEP_0184703028 /NCGR_PEP_ID=MMETSP0313-20130426/26303_1 /TAXON_ID=2792 /ORGANISM="Porphyridium aerugineum, Strain SAG 1380-2" /LENGTH=361 /DNA_ID=CAMNT_0027163667 /DNA_START=37 /DNA_END=1122 /DNA_ORIENTATION=+